MATVEHRYRDSFVEASEVMKTDLSAIHEQDSGHRLSRFGLEEDAGRQDKGASMRKIKSFGILRARQRTQSIDTTYDTPHETSSSEWLESVRSVADQLPSGNRVRTSTMINVRGPTHANDWQHDYFGKEWSVQHDAAGSRSRTTTKDSQHRHNHSRDASETSYASAHGGSVTPGSADHGVSSSSRILTSNSQPPLPHDARSKWKKHVRTITPSNLKISKLLAHRRHGSRSTTLNSSPSEGSEHYLHNMEIELRAHHLRRKGFSASPIMSAESNTSSDNERKPRDRSRGRRKKRESIVKRRSRIEPIMTNKRTSSLANMLLEHDERARQVYWNQGMKAAPRSNSLGLYSPPSSARTVRSYTPHRAVLGLPVPQRRPRKRADDNAHIEIGSTDTVAPEYDQIKRLRTVLAETLGNGHIARARRGTCIPRKKEMQSSYDTAGTSCSSPASPRSASNSQSRTFEVKSLLDYIKTVSQDRSDESALALSQSAKELVSKLIFYVKDDNEPHSRPSRSRFPSCDDMLCDIVADATLCRQVNDVRGGYTVETTGVPASAQEYGQALGILCSHLSSMQT